MLIFKKQYTIVYIYIYIYINTPTHNINLNKMNTPPPSPSPPTFNDFLNSLPLPSSSSLSTGYTSSLRKSSLTSTYSKSIAIHKELSQLDYNVRNTHTYILILIILYRTLYHFYHRSINTHHTQLPCLNQNYLHQQQ